MLLQKIKLKGLFYGVLLIFSLLNGLSCTFAHKNKRVYAQANAIQEGKAECVMELNSRRILYAKNAENSLPMASTTKILTAITVLEMEKNIERQIQIPKAAVGVEGSSVYLQENSQYSIKDLLYGLMLRSGNDCATALALYCGKSIENFACLMNKTAQKAGALHSNFKNPHGLPCRNHHTTAIDLALISCYAMQNPIFRDIVSTKYYAPRNWKNKNKILSFCDDGVGIKTGFTKEAGRCLVSARSQGNTTIICTVLNCPNMYERSISLLDDAFALYTNECLMQKDRRFTLIHDKKSVQAYADVEFYYPLLKEEFELVEIKTQNLLQSYYDENKREIIGQFQIYLAKQLLFSGNLYKL